MSFASLTLWSDEDAQGWGALDLESNTGVRPEVFRTPVLDLENPLKTIPVLYLICPNISPPHAIFSFFEMSLLSVGALQIS